MEKSGVESLSCYHVALEIVAIKPDIGGRPNSEFCGKKDIVGKGPGFRMWWLLSLNLSSVAN